MEELLRELLNALDIIGKEQGEIYDSECHQQMANAVFYLFIKPKENYECPEEFGLFSESANQKVNNALTTYIQKASQLAKDKGLNLFQQRLAAFQNGEVRSDIELTYFDDYFGWANPKHFDPDGNVIKS